MNILVIKHQSSNENDALSLIADSIASDVTNAQICWMSNSGNNFEFTQDFEKPSHMFATGKIIFNYIFILKKFPCLWDCTFTDAWLRRLLKYNGDGNTKILIEDKVLINRNYPKERPSIYKFLWNKFSKFGELYEKTCHSVDPVPQIGSGNAQRAFIYSLYGVWNNGHIVERAINEMLHIDKLRVLDMGAGYGFMAVDMALKGHEVVMVDSNTEQLDIIGSWLCDTCYVADKVKMMHGHLEDIDKVDGKFDLIIMFASLLYAKREDVALVIKNSFDKLNSGGKLLIREIPQEIASIESLDFEYQFKAKELEGYIEKYKEGCKIYNIFSGKEMDWQKAENSIIMLEINKP